MNIISSKLKGLDKEVIMGAFGKRCDYDRAKCVMLLISTIVTLVKDFVIINLIVLFMGAAWNFIVAPAYQVHKLSFSMAEIIAAITCFGWFITMYTELKTRI